MKVYVILLSFIVVGCAHSQKRAGADLKNVQKTNAVLAQEQKMREQSKQRESDRNRALVVAKKREQVVHVPTVIGKFAQLSEADLYRESLNAFDSNDEIGFRSRYQMFLSKFPKSTLVDDVFYLSGLMYLSNKNYGMALGEFNRILKDHAASNRASSAQFAKAVALKRMNLKDQAKTAFERVTKQYAGSPESVRAANELKLLR